MAVDDALGAGRGQTIPPGALKQPDEAIDARSVLDDLVTAESDGVVGENRGRIQLMEGSSVRGVRRAPVGRGKDDSPASHPATRLGTYGICVSTAALASRREPKTAVDLENDRRVARVRHGDGTRGCRCTENGRRS